MPAGRSSYSSVLDLVHGGVEVLFGFFGIFEIQCQLAGFLEFVVGLGLACVRLADGQRGRSLVDDVDVEVVGFGVFDDGGGHHHRPLRRHVVLVLGVLIVGVLVELVEVVFGRPPVRIAAVAGRRSRAFEPSAAVLAVEDPRRQCHVARASHGIALADQHRDQHEEPEHDKRDP